MRLSAFSMASAACTVCFSRSPKFWLGLLSTMTAATDGIGSRSSRVSDGLASARIIRPMAMARTTAPRPRVNSSSTEMTMATPNAVHTT